LSILDPATPDAERIALLSWIMIVASVVILAAVTGLFLFTLRKRRRGRQVPDAVFLWGGGVIFPSVVLVALLGYALGFGGMLAPMTGDDVVRVEAHGHQWRWEFVHHDAPGGPLRIEGELHLPAGRRIDVQVMSSDVIHSFWVPRLGGKIDAIPGQVNRLRIENAAPGTYEGVCAEFCGLDHAGMRFRAVVHPTERYAEILAELARRRSREDDR